MNILLFGATGMVGQGVLRECLLDAVITKILIVGRTTTGIQHLKLQELIHKDMWQYESIETNLSGFDACFFCLGVSSSGMTESDYSHITYDMTLVVAKTLSRLNPHMTFVYVSGSGTDSTESGRSMWARVKGKTENALLQLPFKAAVMLRPGVIQPLHGIRSKTPVYRVIYILLKPILSPMRALFPAFILTTEQIGRAMIAIARHGAPKAILETKDIYDLLNRR